MGNMGADICFPHHDNELAQVLVSGWQTLTFLEDIPEVYRLRVGWLNGFSIWGHLPRVICHQVY